MSVYADVSVIVDGALEESERFFDETLMRAYFAAVEEDARSHGYPVDVFVLYHDHDPGECECVQYLTDHRPALRFNQDGS